MLKTEVAELFKSSGRVYDIAEKENYGLTLTSEEVEATKVIDAWAKNFRVGNAEDLFELSAFITRTVNEEVYEAPDELLDAMFNRGSVGEFDDAEYQKSVKNTLKAFEAAKGGTVDRSFIDFGVLAPQVKNLQVATDLSYVDIRKNGWKSISTLTTFCNEALRNKQFGIIFALVDAALAAGAPNVITAAGATPTIDEMDQLSLYINEASSAPGEGMIVSLMKYAQAIRRMSGYAQYLSNEMKNEFNRYGLVRLYDGLQVAGISSLHKLGDGSTQVPGKRIFGIAGKIGFLDQKGEVHTYADYDNQNEVVHIMVKDFTFNFVINDISKVAKMILS